MSISVSGGEDRLVGPYGGRLVNLLTPDGDLEMARARANKLPRVQLTPRSICDLELLATGGFSPVDRFLAQSDYLLVLDEMRLASNVLFPIPITLPVSRDASVKLDSEVTLIDQYNNPLAIMRVEEIYHWDKEREARSVYCTTDRRHPLVSEMNAWGEVCLSGELRVLALPRHYDFGNLRLIPAEVRSKLRSLGACNVVAFQTRNPLHLAHEELTRRAAQAVEGVLLLHPVVGMTKPGDIDHFARVRSYKVLAERYYDRNRMVLALLPLAMRMAGPREV
jgi:sulfate adenylyltransferase